VRYGKRRTEWGDEGASGWQPGLYLKLVLLGLAIAYGIGLIVANDEQTELDFVFGDTEASLVVIILVSLGIGLVAGVLLSQLYRRRRRRELREELPEPVDAVPDLRGRDEAEGEPGGAPPPA